MQAMEVSGKHQRITEVLQDYWQQKNAGGIMPSEEDIDPQDLGDLWEHCFLVQKMPDNKFMYLHMGSAIIEAYGDDLTGQEVCEKLVGQLHEPLVAKFHETIERGRPVLDESSFINRKQMDIRYRTCLLPLRKQAREAAYILGGMKWKAY